VLGVMDALQIEQATLAFGCANGFYAMRAAQMAPQRITRLVLAQTPSLAAMHGCTARVVLWPLRARGTREPARYAALLMRFCQPS
jgi:pimeloyl-ACP methyl ester carboxylesterase